MSSRYDPRYSRYYRPEDPRPSTSTSTSTSSSTSASYSTYYGNHQCCRHCCHHHLRESYVRSEYRQQVSYDRFCEVQGTSYRDTERTVEYTQVNRSSFTRWTGASGSGIRRPRRDEVPETPIYTRRRQTSCNQENDWEKGSESNERNPQNRRSSRPVKEESVTLSSLTSMDRDCILIPVSHLHHFYPDQYPLPDTPLTEEERNWIKMFKMEDTKECLLMHFMSEMKPIEPLYQTPLDQPLFMQMELTKELIAQIGQERASVEGMLLTTVERICDFPFMTYYVLNTTQHNPREFFLHYRRAVYEKFHPRKLGYTIIHNMHLFVEVASIAKPPIHAETRQPLTRTTGYIVSLYNVHDGSDKQKFERNWLCWTGARMLYWRLPDSVGLRRITLHKSLTRGDRIDYVLICECTQYRDMSGFGTVVPDLRARLCGCPWVYKHSINF